MAYGLRYISTAYGLSSVQWKVELYEKDYTPIVGSLPTELRLVGDGIKIGYDRNDDRFTTIYSRYAILDFKATVNFDINTLQFDDEKKYQVKIYRNNLVEFVGWLIPFYSSQEFEDIKISKISVQAKDGINQLKNKKYIDERPEIATNRQSQKDIISQCLREIGYNMTLEVYYNKFESSMSKTSIDCPLAQTDFNIYSLEKDETTNLDYYEVLDRILKTHDLRIAQAQGVWRIVSQIEVLDGVATGRIYNYLGEFQSAKTLNTDVTFHTGGLKVKSNSIIRKDIPIQQISAFYEVGVFTNILPNGKLTQFSGNTPINWTPIGGWAINEVSRILNSNGIQFDNTFTTSEGIGEKYFESAEIDITGLSSFKFTAEAYADSDIDSVKIAIILYSSINSSYKYYVDKYGSIKEKEVTAIIDKGSQDKYVTFDLSFVTNSATQYLNGVDKIKIRIYPGVKLTSVVPTKKKVKFKNLILTGQANSYDKEFLGRVYEYKNNALTGSKVQDEYAVYYQDNIGASISKFRNTLFIAGTNTVTNSWKRTAETTSRTLLESCLIDRLSVTAKFNDIFEGILKGYINLINTPFLSANSKRFLVLSSEYSLQEDSTEVVLVELASSNISYTTKIYDRYNGGKTVDVSEGVNSESINGNEDYDKPIKSNGGISHGIIYPDGGIDSLPKDTTNPRASNKGILIFGGTNAEGIELGNKENQTLVDVLGGKIKLGYNLLYDKSITDGDGDIVKQLGVDSDFQVDGRIEAVSGISVGQDGLLITKELGTGGKPFGQVDAQNELRFVSPVVNVTNVLGVNQITGINGLGVNVNAPFTFNQPIYVLPSNNPNSPITNAQFDVALLSYDFGNIRIYGAVSAASIGANINLSGLQTIDGVILTDGTKILVKDQTNAVENYIYIVRTGTWERVSDLPNNTIKGVQVQVIDGGLVNKGGIFVNTNTTAINIGTTAVTFRQSFQNVTSLNFASLLANNQIFSGTNKFTNKLEVRNPESSTEAINLFYLDYRISGVTTNISDLSTNVTNNYWRKINNYGIGTTTLNSLEFYVNNVKKAQLISNGILTGLKAIHINDAAFNYPFLTSLPFYYGASIKDNVHIGALTGTSKALYSLDLIRGGTTGYRSGVRFGSYNSAGEVNQFYYGIEYSTADKLSIGRYSTTFMDGANTSLDAAKTATVDSLGNWAFGKNAAAYRIDVNGDVNVSGMYRINGSFGADHTFLKSNGTTQEFAIMTVGEIADISTYYTTKQDAVLYGTFEGERGFKLYHDVAKLDTAALFFANQDTGIVGIHYYGLDNSNNLTQHGVHIDGDGFVYHKKLNGSRARFLTTDDSLSNGGITYSFAEPLYLNGTQVNVRVASATSFGILTKEDWIRFNAGTGSGGTTYSYTDPIYLDGSAVKVRVASATQNGVLTKEDWNIFNGKQNTLLKASATQDGYLSKEDFSAFLAGTGGGSGITYTFTDPLYLDGSAVKIKVATSTQNGVLTKENWTTFNNKQNTLAKASSTTDGYLSKEDFSAFLAGIGSGGTTYSFANPLYLSGNEVNIYTSSATQTGVLTSTKFTEFNAKFGEGSTVNFGLVFKENASLWFNSNNFDSNGSISLYGYSSSTPDLVIQNHGSASNMILISDNKIELKTTNNIIKLSRGYIGDVNMFTEVQIGSERNNSIINFNGTNFNFKSTTTPTNGQKFLVQYDSFKSTFFFVPA